MAFEPLSVLQALIILSTYDASPFRRSYFYHVSVFGVSNEKQQRYTIKGG